MPGNLLVMAALGLEHLRLVVFFGRNVFASAANGCAAWLVVVLTEESLNREKPTIAILVTQLKSLLPALMAITNNRLIKL